MVDGHGWRDSMVLAIWEYSNFPSVQHLSSYLGRQSRVLSTGSAVTQVGCHQWIFRAFPIWALSFHENLLILAGISRIFPIWAVSLYEIFLILASSPEAGHSSL